MGYDVIVIGLGAMGSAIAWELARRGKRVLGLDRFARGRSLGASRGDSRLIRRACYEHPVYAALAERAWGAWRALERRTGRALARATPIVTIGREDGAMLGGIALSERAHGPVGRRLSARELRAEHPCLEPRDDEVAFVDPDCAILHADLCLRALQQLAAAAGAELRFDTTAALDHGSLDRARGALVRWGDTVVQADHAIVAAGAWAAKLAPRSVMAAVRAERVVSCWFEHADLDPGRRAEQPPVVLWERGERALAIIPNAAGRAVKVANHHSGELVDADAVDRSVADAEVEDLRRQLLDAAPRLAGPLLRTDVCMYATAPDRHFVIGPVGGGAVWLASACSGHGFKYAPVVGQLVAELMLDGVTGLAASLFAPDRPSLFAPDRPALA